MLLVSASFFCNGAPHVLNYLSGSKMPYIKACLSLETASISVPGFQGVFVDEHSRPSISEIVFLYLKTQRLKVLFEQNKSPLWHQRGIAQTMVRHPPSEPPLHFRWADARKIIIREVEDFWLRPNCSLCSRRQDRLW